MRSHFPAAGPALAPSITARIAAALLSLLVLGVAVLASPPPPASAQETRRCTKRCKKQQRACTRGYKRVAKEVKVACNKDKKCRRRAGKSLKRQKKQCRKQSRSCARCCRRDPAGDCLLVDPGTLLCGNGVVEAPEGCDEGLGNSDLTPDACRSDCRAPRCGDGVIDPGAGEQCEPPATGDCNARCGSAIVATTTTTRPTSTTLTTTTTTLPGCPLVALLTTGAGGSCGRSNDAADGLGTDLAPFGGGPLLECGALYVGGGGPSLQPPVSLPEGATSVLKVTDCSDPRALRLAPAATAETGSVDTCTAAGCPFGPPLPIPNTSAAETSTCVLVTFAEGGAARGVLDAATGESTLTLPLTLSVFVSGDLESAPGVQPCPTCVAGTCGSGRDSGQPCTSETSAGTTYDCLPPVDDALPPLDVTLALRTGTATMAHPGGDFCAATTGQRTPGCFGSGRDKCRYIEMAGEAAGDLSGGDPGTAIYASAFCMPATGNARVDALMNLPGPAAVTIPADLQLIGSASGAFAFIDPAASLF
jgi:hypothetical protein